MFTAAERFACRLIFSAMAAGLVLATAILAQEAPITGPGFLLFLAGGIPAIVLAFACLIAALSAGDTPQAWRACPPPGLDRHRFTRARRL